MPLSLDDDGSAFLVSKMGCVAAKGSPDANDGLLRPPAFRQLMSPASSVGLDIRLELGKRNVLPSLIWCAAWDFEQSRRAVLADSRFQQRQMRLQTSHG